MIGKWVSPYIWTILLKCNSSNINQTLYFVHKSYTLLNGVPRDATMIGVCGIRIVLLRKLRLIDLSQAYHDHLVAKQGW